MNEEEFKRVINEVKTGAKFKADLRSGYHVEGKIYVVKGEKFYLCHDNPCATGSAGPDKLGYKYSWVVTRDNCYTTLKSIEIYENNNEIITDYEIF